MDIHKPKPWHGWREFLKEYVIIVVGVLTALGAEAVVSNLHEARLSAEAKEAVLDEINVNITFHAARLESEACIARRIDEIGTLLDKAEAGEPFAPPARMAGPPALYVYMSRWSAATAGGRTSLLSSREQRQFGRVYAELEHLQQFQQAEAEAWFTLRALVGRKHLSQGLIDQERIALAHARPLDAAVANAFENARFYARELGVKGDARIDYARKMSPGPSPICRPMTDSNPAG